MGKVHAIIPFKLEGAKSRLSNVMSMDEREEFSFKMLQDVLKSLNPLDMKVSILSTSEIELGGYDILISKRRLNDALNEILSEEKEKNPVLILMSDLPLITSEIVERILRRTEDVVIVPGRKGGTNVLFIRDPSRFKVNYYGISFKNHEEIAREGGLSYLIYDSMLAGTDIDEEEDLLDLLIFGEGGGKKLSERDRFFCED
jgi:2-phospho-L-lactate guanylyltransferase CofC